MQRNRRDFMNDVGNGMLLAGLGTALAGDLGITSAFAEEGAAELSFGKLEPLVNLMQEKPGQKLQPLLVEKLKNNETTLREMIAAAALANAETFGGEDYVGFHTEMALIPALEMAKEMPKDRRALPVLKVLYRNADRIQASGLAKKKTLHPVKPASQLTSAQQGGEGLRAATRAADMQQAEQIFAAQAQGPLEDAYNALLWSVEDAINVHRFVLAHRAYGLIDIVGKEHAHTLLRQCVRFCVDAEQGRLKRKQPVPPVRALIPKLLDQYGLAGRKLGTRKPDDAWLDETATFLFERTGAEGMEAVAAALAEGISPEAVGEAISLASNLLVLRQGKINGDPRAHGATPGVHSSDATNAWRQMTRISDHRNRVVGLMVAAFHTGGYERYAQEDVYPHSVHREAIKTTDAKKLLQAAEDAIRHNEQGHATAAVQIYSEQGYAAKPVFDLMLRYAVSEDGRLHAEKYYQTVTEEFAAARPAFRWRQLVALARVTASAYGFDVNDRAGHRAPGYEEACGLLGVKA